MNQIVKVVQRPVTVVSVARAVGPRGAVGDDSVVPGPQGDPGVAGLQGSGGAVGPQGMQGVAGFAGAPGVDGAQGVPGVSGASGSTGAAGTDGAQGTQGLPGVDGATGPAGADGTQGAPGTAGTQGIQGLTGVKGDTGLQGTQGAASTVAGPQGATGAQGIPGVMGATGATGAASTVAGPQGIQGVKGDTGITGAQGVKGDTGDAGTGGGTTLPAGTDGQYLGHVAGAPGWVAAPIAGGGSLATAFRGTWSGLTDYAAGDLAQTSTATFLCLVDSPAAYEASIVGSSSVAIWDSTVALGPPAGTSVGDMQVLIAYSRGQVLGGMESFTLGHQQPLPNSYGKVYVWYRTVTDLNDLALTLFDNPFAGVLTTIHGGGWGGVAGAGGFTSPAASAPLILEGWGGYQGEALPFNPVAGLTDQVSASSGVVRVRVGASTGSTPGHAAGSDATNVSAVTVSILAVTPASPGADWVKIGNL